MPSIRNIPYGQRLRKTITEIQKGERRHNRGIQVSSQYLPSWQQPTHASRDLTRNEGTFTKAKEDKVQHNNETEILLTPSHKYLERLAWEYCKRSLSKLPEKSPWQALEWAALQDNKLPVNDLQQQTTRLQDNARNISLEGNRRQAYGLSSRKGWWWWLKQVHSDYNALCTLDVSTVRSHPIRLTPGGSDR